MTEVSFNKKAFLATLEALQNQFTLATNDLTLETEPNGERFMLGGVRTDGNEVKAFGPCQVHGEPVHVNFDLKDIESAILSAHEGQDSETVTFIIGDGLWVKDPIQID
jgi:hypothetical protein